MAGGRKAGTAALAILGAFAFAGELERYEDDVVGVALEVPPGFEAERPEPAEGATARAVRLTWRDGPGADLDVLIVSREARYENVLLAAGRYRRRFGLSEACGAEPRGEAELARAGAEDGLRVSYAGGEESEARRREAVFLSSGGKLYRLEISYPGGTPAEVGEAVEEMINTLEIMRAEEEVAEKTGEPKEASE